MDILERLNKNIEAAQNGPYVGIKEQRDSWHEAAQEIERLRKDNSDYQEALKSKRENIQKIDIALNGENAADQASACDLIDDANRLRKQVEAMKWREIESAPRDGAQIMIYQKGKIPMVGYLSQAALGWITVPGGYKLNPTHWMPLPPAPEGE